MPVVTVLPDRLELRLTRAERLLAFHRGDVVIDRSSIRSATVTEDPWIWVRGIRAPGTAVPLTIAAGTWKFHGGKDFLLIKRTASAVVLDLVDEDWSRLIISTKHAPELIAALQLGPTTAAIPIIETDDLVVVPEVAEQAAARLAATDDAATARETEAVGAADADRPAVPPASPAEDASLDTEQAVAETSAVAEAIGEEPAPAKKPAAKRKPAAKKPAAKASAETPAPEAPEATAVKPRARTPRPDSSVGHASAEPSGATEAAE
ncbi:hypothetical protein MT349_07345 [Rathayibacter caricis]|uniref:hypothetical protein n=1 Tax=Rathayibacter caricis TaxID=110936 RepID=UPI001FB370B1|nr:hypothetical protein [Rathayibacter caricis]MCJ1695594.1 hypothetical protein [Rathayibacter caricis]